MSKMFFGLTAAEKHNVNMVNSKHFRGYSGVAVEKTATVADQREVFIVRSTLVEASGTLPFLI